MSDQTNSQQPAAGGPPKTRRELQQERREQQRAAREQQQAARAQKARQERQLKLIGGIVLAAVIIAGLLIFLNRPTGTGELQIMAAPIPEGVPVNGRVLGDPNAPVTIIEYGDYQCPYCGIVAREDLPTLIDEFVATGQASFEYRDLAFLGPESSWAAEAAACAEDQDAFWPFHKTVFANQNQENQGAFTRERLESMAEQLGLDMDEFRTCVNNGTHAEAVVAMADEARAAGINATPTFVINGVVTPYNGLDGLRDAINLALTS